MNICRRCFKLAWSPWASNPWNNQHCLKDFELMGCLPRVKAVGPASFAYALAAGHPTVSARSNTAAWGPLEDVWGQTINCFHRCYVADLGIKGQSKTSNVSKSLESATGGKSVGWLPLAHANVFLRADISTFACLLSLKYMQGLLD